MVTRNHGSFGIIEMFLRFLGSGVRRISSRGTMTPVIGITTYEDQASWRNWSARAAMLPYVYVDAVRRSGARAILLPPGGDDDEASATVASLDGLVVAGGPDIDPVRYGASRHPRTQAPV